MKRLVLSVAAAVAAAFVAFSAPAMAGDGHHHNGGWGKHRPVPHPGAGWHRGGGGIGFEIVIGNPGPVYRPVVPGPRYYHHPRRVIQVVPPVKKRHVVANAHVQWCAHRYRTYRAWDNTFQPNHGARRACVSPWGGR